MKTRLEPHCYVNRTSVRLMWVEGICRRRQLLVSNLIKTTFPGTSKRETESLESRPRHLLPDPQVRYTRRWERKSFFIVSRRLRPRRGTLRSTNFRTTSSITSFSKGHGTVRLYPSTSVPSTYDCWQSLDGCLRSRLGRCVSLPFSVLKSRRRCPRGILVFKGFRRDNLWGTVDLDVLTGSVAEATIFFSFS